MMNFSLPGGQPHPEQRVSPQPAGLQQAGTPSARHHIGMTALRLCLLLVLAAFVPDQATAQEAPNDGQQEADEGSQEADERAFVAGFVESRVSFDPLQSITALEGQIYTAIYEGLVSYNPVSLDPIPGVASRWTIGPEGRVYTFYLRSSARYWNGDQVTAAHFRDAWMRLLEENASFSFMLDVVDGAFEYRTGLVDDPTTVGIRVPDDQTLVVRLARPAAHFLKVLAHHSFSPIHPRMLAHPDWSQLPSVLGNGPYYIIDRQEDRIVLARNELYWDVRRVEIERLVLEFYADSAEATTRFVDGQIDWLASAISFRALSNTDNLVVNPMFATRYYFFNNETAPFNDERVRRALMLLLPWPEIRDPRSLYLPADTLVPAVPGYPVPEQLNETNLPEAFRLLEEAGVLESLPEISIRLPGDPEFYPEAQVMERVWEQYLDVEVNFDVVGSQDYYDSLEDGSFTLASTSWIGDFSDPLAFLQMWTSGSSLNDARYSDETFDGLILESFGQPGARRYESLSRAESRLLQSAGAIPISHSPAINLVDLGEISGWYPNALDIHPFKYFRFTSDAPLQNLAGFDGLPR